jgi:hypothetical protein
MVPFEQKHDIFPITNITQTSSTFEKLLHSSAEPSFLEGRRKGPREF